MEATLYCVYNQRRENFLSPGVTIANPAPEQLRSTWQQFASPADRGLHITPLEGEVGLVQSQTVLAGRLRRQASPRVLALHPLRGKRCEPLVETGFQRNFPAGCRFCAMLR